MQQQEHHLQAALSASQAAAVGGKVDQIYIPTPETIQSSIHYDRLYPRSFAQPATYIRFSSTVEDCCGCPYDMDEEDDMFLKSLNSQRNASTQCSEDQFEEVMNFFEDTAQTKQPYAAVDSPPVLPFGDMEESFDENIHDPVRAFAKDIYDHWRTRRLEVGNKALITRLKVVAHRREDLMLSLC
jgi:enhancer of polycomb-like protein